MLGHSNQIEIAEAQVDQFGGADAGVQQRQQDGRVPQAGGTAGGRAGAVLPDSLHIPTFDRRPPGRFTVMLKPQCVIGLVWSALSLRGGSPRFPRHTRAQTW